MPSRRIVCDMQPMGIGTVISSGFIPTREDSISKVSIPMRCYGLSGCSRASGEHLDSWMIGKDPDSHAMSGYRPCLGTRIPSAVTFMGLVLNYDARDVVAEEGAVSGHGHVLLLFGVFRNAWQDCASSSSSWLRRTYRARKSYRLGTR